MASWATATLVVKSGSGEVRDGFDAVGRCWALTSGAMARPTLTNHQMSHAGPPMILRQLLWLGVLFMSWSSDSPRLYNATRCGRATVA